MKNLYTVRKKNPFWAVGSYVEKSVEGVQKCITGILDGRMSIDGFEGFVIPWRECEFCLMRVQSRGLDAGSARADRRTRQGRFVDQDAVQEEEVIDELVDSYHERKLWPVDGTKLY